METIEQGEIERLQNSAMEMDANLRRLRVRHSSLAAELDACGDAVRRGAVRRAATIPDLLKEQAAIAVTITAQEGELAEVQTELKRQTAAAKEHARAALFERMEQRRERIIELSRQLALELGELQGNDREEGTLLVEPVVSPTQQRFIELLSPVLPFEGSWYGAHRALPCGYEHTIKIPAFVKL